MVHFETGRNILTFGLYEKMYLNVYRMVITGISPVIFLREDIPLTILILITFNWLASASQRCHSNMSYNTKRGKLLHIYFTEVRVSGLYEIKKYNSKCLIIIHSRLYSVNGVLIICLIEKLKTG